MLIAEKERRFNISNSPMEGYLERKAVVRTGAAA